MPVQSHVRMAVYDVLGREVDILVSAEYQAGTYRVVWNTDRASGTYFVVFEADAFSATRKLLLLR